MVSTAEFLLLVQANEKVDAQHIADLKEIVETYPYFAQAHTLLAKGMKNLQNVNSEKYISNATLYCSNLRQLYFDLNPQYKINPEDYNFKRKSKNNGDYFSMLETIEKGGRSTKQSLKSLALKLKEARTQLQTEEKTKTQAKTPDKQNFVAEPQNASQSALSPEISENEAKKLIAEKKYLQAIDILRQLNLLYPKKSIYFAAQIRFLERIV
ncbi:MAG: hypothetical protein LBV75_01405 [Paludibacter sp.]|jgi:hypothetical protein|nr:hypothetical protein [Paludibacter sp.]